MNKFQKVCCAVCFAVAATGAQAIEYVAADDNPISQLCVSAAVDSPIRFFVHIRDARVATGFVANKISCNGINITNFAKQAGNEHNYQYLSNYRRGHVEISDLAQVTSTPLPFKTVSGRVAEVARP